MRESHVHGSKSPPLIETTIGQALEVAADRWGDQLALVSSFQGLRWTWAELLSRSDRLAAGLLDLGLAAGDRVGVWSPNCAEWALAQFACARAGLIFVTINPAYRRSEVAHALRRAGVSALISPRAFKTSDYAGMIESLPRADLPALRSLILLGEERRPGWLAFDEVATSAGAAEVAAIAAAQPSIGAGEATNIQFTSGTTGAPKGATLSHRNILNNGFFVGEGLRLTAADRICVPVPLYHCFGMVLGNLAAVTHGAAVVYPSPSFEPEATLRAVAEERCTALYGVPTMFIALLEAQARLGLDVSSLRTGIMAGAPCPVEVMKSVIDRLNIGEMEIAYGMTETSPVSFQTAPDDPLERRVSTVGRVQPHLEVKIVDPEGATTPVGAPGELCTKGYAVMLGYWDEPGKTAEVLGPDGWMHTGDVAVIDDAGYANIVGRIKDMVIRGGENLYPREIEEFLFRHPKIAEVAIVGVPDPRMGEELCAWIRLAPGESLAEDDVRDFCRGEIAHFKIPRHIRFVEEFPMTVTGKVQKFLIRQAMIEELGVTVAQTA